jgi:PKD domain-containing protein/FG-GAP repeat protein
MSLSLRSSNNSQVTEILPRVQNGRSRAIHMRFALITAVLACMLTANVFGSTIEIVSPTDEAEGHFGYALSGIPDLDGDGLEDFIIGGYQEDAVPSATDSGRAYVYSGSGAVLIHTLISNNMEEDGFFGCSVSGIPDVDGDGRGDFIVGARQEDPGAAPSNTGRAYIYSGSDASLLHTLTSQNEESSGNFAYSVSGIPDVDGDGRGDVIVGAWYEDPGSAPSNTGRAYIFSGSSGNWLHTLASPNEENGGNFGNSVSGIPDVDGDGRGDVIVGAFHEDAIAGATNSGRAYIFSGSSGILLHTLYSENAVEDAYFGERVSGMADITGDGRGDVLTGAPFEVIGAFNSGRAYLYSGSDGVLDTTFTSPNQEAWARFGFSVSGVPDTNGDGVGDILIGAWGEDPGDSPASAGRAYVYSGSGSALLQTLVSLDEQTNGIFGFTVAGMGDANGDSLGDILVGAYWEDATTFNSGRAWVFNSTAPEFQMVIPQGVLDFGSQDVDSGASLPRAVAFNNIGDGDLLFTGQGMVIDGADAGDFDFAYPKDTSALTPGLMRTLVLAFDPSSPGPKTATLRITSNDLDEATVEVTLQGTGVTPTPTPTSTPTSTSTDTPTDTPTSTATNTPTPTDTYTPTPTDTPLDTPTNTSTPTHTPTHTFTSTNTPTPTPTNIAPAAFVYSFPSAGAAPLNVDMLGIGLDLDGSLVEYQWLYADTLIVVATGTLSSSSAEETLQQIYNTPGIYQMLFQLEDNKGDIIQATSEVVVWTNTATPTPTDTSTPTSTATDTNTPTPVDTNTPTPTATDLPTSTFTPTFTPTDTYTFTPTNTATFTPTPTNVSPSAIIFHAPKAGAAPLLVELSAAGFDQDGLLIQYDWSLVDWTVVDASSVASAPAIEAATSRTYTDPGTYQVAFRVTDNNGAISQATGEVVVWTNTPTFTPTSTSTPTLIPTDTPTPTPTATSTAVPTDTPTPTITATPTMTPTPDPLSLSDINQDGVINHLDILQLMQWWLQPVQ